MESNKSIGITETGLVKQGSGKVKGVVINSHSSGTLKLIDGSENSTGASVILTSTGASAPASHATSKITSAGASVAGSHAVSVLTGSANFKDKVKASAVLTSDQTIPTAGDTVTVGTDVFTFIADNLVGSKYNVRLGTTATQAMLNLFEALKNCPDVDVVHTSTFVITITAKVAGTAGNSIAKAETSSHLDWDGTGGVLTGGLEAETVTIGTKVYRFKNLLEQANDVLIGATLTASLLNLKNAINGDSATKGISYEMGTVAHTQVVATASNATTITIRGRVAGLSLNTVATTETGASASWADTTLGGGTGASDAGVTTENALVTIGDKVYTIVAELSETLGATAVPYEVLKGVSEATLLDNLKSAINGTTGEGTVYGTGTVAHPDVVATTNADTTQIIVARTVGDDDETTAINALPTESTLANTTWADTTLGGGTGDSNPAVTTAGAEIVLGGKTYTAVIQLSETSGADAVPNQILWVTSEAVFLDNVKKAVNLTGIAGTDYSTGTEQHTQVTATTNANDAQTFVSKLLGASQNAIVSTTNLANYAMATATLANGTGADGRLINDTISFAVGEHEINLHSEEFYTSLFAVIGGTANLSIVFDN